MGVGVVGIVDLVADAPHEYRRMVAVAAHHVGDIAVNPLFKEVVGAVKSGSAFVPALDPLALGKFPLVRSFVHNEKTYSVTHIVECRCLWIVGAAYGIHAY